MDLGGCVLQLVNQELEERDEGLGPDGFQVIQNGETRQRPHGVRICCEDL